MQWWQNPGVDGIHDEWEYHLIFFGNSYVDGEFMPPVDDGNPIGCAPFNKMRDFDLVDMARHDYAEHLCNMD